MMISSTNQLRAHLSDLYQNQHLSASLLILQMIRPNILCSFADDTKLEEAVHTLEARAAIQRETWQAGEMSLYKTYQVPQKQIHLGPQI